MASLVQLTAGQQELAERAHRFVDEVLIPREIDAELAGGRLDAGTVAQIGAAGCGWAAAWNWSTAPRRWR